LSLWHLQGSFFTAECPKRSNRWGSEICCYIPCK